MLRSLYPLFVFPFFSYSQVAPGGVPSGIALWYKADAGVTTSTGVSVWADQSGNIRHLLQGTTSAQPVYNTASNLINFQPTIGFDGTNDFLQHLSLEETATVSNNQSSQFIVFRSRQTGEPTLYQHSSNSGGGYNSAMTGSRAFVLNRFVTLNSLGVENGEVRLQSIQGNAAGTVDGRVNGTTTSSTWLNALANSGPQPFTLGASSSTTFSASDIAEIIIYPNNTNLSNERQRIESYLALKYGITLPFNYLASDNATIYWNTTSNAAYSNNIAGIGRDDSAGLHVKQSQSSHSGNQLIMSLGTIAGTNQGNTASISSNMQFLVWGDNASSAANISLLDIPSSIYYERLARVWRTTVVGGFNNNVQLLLPTSLNTVGGTPYLVINSTGGFVSETNNYRSVSSTQVIDGKYYYVFNLAGTDLANDFYFTLAFLDTDNDGITRQEDLDDDNDGISDILENASENAIVNGTFSSLTTTGWETTGNVNPYTTPTGDAISFNGGDTTPNGILAQITSVYPNNLYSLSFYIGTIIAIGGIGDVALLIEVLQGTTVLASTTVTKNMNSTGTTHTLSFNPTLNTVEIRFTDVSPSTYHIDIYTDDVSLTVFNLDIDGDGILDYLDLDADGDGCPDAIESGAGFTFSDMVFSRLPGGNSGSTYNGTSINSVTQNLGITVGNTLQTKGIPLNAGVGQTIGNSKDKTIKNARCPCKKPSAIGVPLESTVGISGRATTPGWIQNIPNGALVLDSNDKGFVLTRLTTSEINNLDSPVEGMLVFDKTLGVLKLNKGTAGGWVIIKALSCD